MSDYNKKVILKALQQMLNGTLHLVVGCRLIARHRFDIDGISEDNSLFSVFRAVESETDDWALTEEARDKTSDQRLQEMDTANLQYLEEVRSEILKACELLQLRLCGTSS